MEKKQSILIWKYLDGECSIQEKQEVQRLLECDPDFANEMKLAQALQVVLKELEPDQPSMRFNINVTEQLPSLYRPIQTSADLLPQGLVRVLGGLLGSTAVLSLGLFFSGQQLNARKLNFMNYYTLDITSFSNPMIFSAFLISLGVLTYFILDFTLKKWFLKK